MFDPDKIRRFQIDTIKGITVWREDSYGSVTLAVDYDQLLHRYRTLEKYLDDLDVHLPQNLWSDRRKDSVAARQRAQIAHPGSVEGISRGGNNV